MRHWLIHLLITLGTGLWLLLPMSAGAQASGMGIVVTIQTMDGQPVAQATVTARDLDGTPLADAMTDATGRAALPNLSVMTVRVGVSGAGPHGTSLRMMGADADGILLLLDSPATPLTLLVMDDGTVDLDPASMLIRQPSGITMTDALDVREAPAAPPVAQPQPAAATFSLAAAPDPTATATLTTTAALDTADVTDDAGHAADPHPGAFPFLLLIGGVCLLVASVLLLMARRRPRGRLS